MSVPVPPCVQASRRACMRWAWSPRHLWTPMHSLLYQKVAHQTLSRSRPPKGRPKQKWGIIFRFPLEPAATLFALLAQTSIPQAACLSLWQPLTHCLIGTALLSLAAYITVELAIAPSVICYIASPQALPEGDSWRWSRINKRQRRDAGGDGSGGGGDFGQLTTVSDLFWATCWDILLMVIDACFSWPRFASLIMHHVASSTATAQFLNESNDLFVLL